MYLSHEVGGEQSRVLAYIRQTNQSQELRLPKEGSKQGNCLTASCRISRPTSHQSMFWTKYEAIFLKFICRQYNSHKLSQHYGLVVVYPEGLVAKQLEKLREVLENISRSVPFPPCLAVKHNLSHGNVAQQTALQISWSSDLKLK